ncbi:MAG: hypothetical protein PUC47_00095 [Oscillospiraceae bacterium]|nr:hypothetical protein [Oscillospiraceae bacterium]
MKTISVIVYPDRVCIASTKAAGKKPRFAQPQWVPVENGKLLVQEPVRLAALIREQVGEKEKYQVCLVLWPEAYSTVMFSNGKISKRDLKRQRLSELETVFHGDAESVYATDFLLDGGKYTFEGKARRNIYAMQRHDADLMRAAFKAQKLKVASIAPMDAVFAESAMNFCKLNKNEITAVLMLDDACTQLALIHKGRIQMIRPIPLGGSAVLAAYRADMPEKTNDELRQLIREQSMSDDDKLFAKYPVLRDKMLALANRIANEILKNVRNIYGDEKDVSKLLICGNFAETKGLTEHFTNKMNMPCVALKDVLAPNAAANICLREEDLDLYFPFAASAAPENDLLGEWRQMVKDRRRGIAASVVLVLVAAGVACVQPYLMKQLKAERDAAAAVIEQPEYVAVRELMDERSAINRQKAALEEAIANLPHGATNTAGIIKDLYELSAKFGTVSSMSVDYSGKVVQMDFSTDSYDTFIKWQQAVTEGDRFAFVTPPTFSGDTGRYSISAVISADDFEEPKEEEVQQ